jgi:hypothetical protein
MGKGRALAVSKLPLMMLWGFQRFVECGWLPIFVRWPVALYNPVGRCRAPGIALRWPGTSFLWPAISRCAWSDYFLQVVMASLKWLCEPARYPCARSPPRVAPLVGLLDPDSALRCLALPGSFLCELLFSVHTRSLWGSRWGPAAFRCQLPPYLLTPKFPHFFRSSLMACTSFAILLLIYPSTPLFPGSLR